MDKKVIDSTEELKQVQLNILASLHQFCMENGIKYSLAYGTMIGALRHGGFIPWDDDIDVFLLREDYNKLVFSFPKSYKGCYSLLAFEVDKKWHRAYGKLCDNRTIEVEETKNVYPGMGIGIDIFPVDDVPDDMKEWKKYEKKRRFLREVMVLKSLSLSKERSILKNFIVLLGRLILFPFTFSYFARTMIAYSQKHNGKGYKHVNENGSGVYNIAQPWKKSDFEEVQDIHFENIVVKIIEGYDCVLNSIYGDYMQLPPEEKRVSHHGFRAFWK